MKNKFIRLALAGTISIGVLASSSSAFAVESKEYSKQTNPSKNIVLLAQNDGLKDGRYNVSFQTLKEKSDELSMAGQYIDSNAVLKVQDGSMCLTIKVLRNDWMKNIKVLIDDSEVNYSSVVEDSEGKVATLRFEIPNKKPNIKLKMNVVPMGNADVAFRVALNDDIEKIPDVKSEENSANKTTEKNTKKNLNTEKELPQTGFPISNGNLLMMGGVTTLLGIGLLKKRK